MRGYGPTHFINCGSRTRQNKSILEKSYRREETPAGAERDNRNEKIKMLQTMENKVGQKKGDMREKTENITE
jgi:hypothetical protein